jgi:glycosyltransferase involved in cell wall biosynthesis
MSDVTISVVTPSLNQAAFLADAVESVATQDHPALEHLVIDAVSTDGTVEFLESRPDLTWTSEPDEGQSDALNKGFLRAKGDVIAWLNADDRYLPGAFAAVARHFEEHPEVDVLYGDINWIDEHGVVFEHRPSLPFDPFALRYLHWLVIPSPATFFRADIVRDGHLIDPTYQWAMDYEFFLRLASLGYRFTHISRALADFRLQPDSKTGVGPSQQLREHRQAAIAGNPSMRRLPTPLQVPAWTTLSTVARARRVMTKARAGHYRRAMRPGPRPEFVAKPPPWARTVRSAEPVQAGTRP